MCKCNLCMIYITTVLIKSSDTDIQRNENSHFYKTYLFLRILHLLYILYSTTYAVLCQIPERKQSDSINFSIRKKANQN